MLRLRRFIKPYGLQFFLGSFVKLLEAVLEVFLPLFMARILDIGIPNGDKAYILKMGGWLFLFAAVGLGFAVFCQYSAAAVSFGSGALIRTALMEKISSFSYRELDRLGTSTLINRLTGDVTNVQQAIAMTIRLVSRAPFLCIGAVVMAFYVDSQLALVFVALIPLLGLFLYLFMTGTAHLYRAAQQKLDALAGIVRENLSGVRIIRAFARWDKEKARSDAAARELADANVRVARLAALTNPATSILMQAGTVVILYLGAGRVYAGALTRGNVLALTTYATKILYALIVVANLIVLFTKASASAGRISEVLDTQPSILFESQPAIFSPHADAVAFKGVSFSYSGQENALTDISFDLPKGRTLGIVGITGSGKSTLINLLQRFYDVDSGTVLIGGAPLRSLPQGQLRAAIGVVPQQSVLFTGTIADNLRWGKDDATDEEMWAALSTAQARDFVESLAGGLDSQIVEGGKNFSGGQRQRLAIARALVKRPPILILDDSLSALDYKTDLELRRALKRDLPDTTLLVVSQRISSVAGADMIVVLDDGRLSGLGTHGELLESCDTYRDIYLSQTDASERGA